MTGRELECAVVALALVRQDRALLDRLRAEWMIADGGVRALLRDLQDTDEPPSWIEGCRVVRERGLRPSLLGDLAAAVDDHAPLDLDELVGHLRWRAGRVAAFSRVAA